ncbi:MAG: DUF3160 domain-containing protein [Verrucomicrobiales bacterium]|nr:DUF3160 domain-containing protein [Verrucomicrobiales bacterium]
MSLSLHCTFVLLTVPLMVAAQTPVLSLKHSGEGIELSWPGAITKLDGSVARPIFELQHSLDLRNWSSTTERLRARDDLASLRFEVAQRTPHTFYRLLAVDSVPVQQLSGSGAEVFGYASAFARELEGLGQISTDQFADLFPNRAEYLPGISWDPTNSAFWNEFNVDIGTLNQGKEFWERGYRQRDYRLNGTELIEFKRNGFVTSERLGSPSFGHAFYDLWHAELPVFISCDSILQAWHRTYDALLQELEETYLYASLEKLLDQMALGVSSTAGEISSGTLKPSVEDADYFLTVARALLADPNGSLVSSSLGQEQPVAQTLAAIRAGQLVPLECMGFCRMIDFSQFRVRGHYTHTERLKRYFQCMTWLGRIDIPVASGPGMRCPQDERVASPRELGVAIVLWHLLNASGQFDLWREMQRTLEVFVGSSDGLNFAQLAGLLAGANFRNISDIPDIPTIERLQAEIVRGELGIQNIRSDWFQQPLGGAATYALPRTFAFFGQKFTPDSWAMSQTVFDSIFWVENSITNKVKRRVPIALDVAFSVLANDQAVPDLVRMMKGQYDNAARPHARIFRDGLNYQHNLAAVRKVMDRQTPEAWNTSIYMNWLACLRALSAPTTDSRFPEALRTRAWAQKTINTQLASWTQLRHDTGLYTKQSYTDFGFCMFPRGFVEPRLDFWDRLTRMAGVCDR